MRRNSQPQGVHDGVEKDFNAGDEKAEYEIVLNHLYVGGRGKSVANLPKSFLDTCPSSFNILWFLKTPLNLFCLKYQYLNEQCSLNQHSCKVDCHNGLKEESLEIGDNRIRRHTSQTLVQGSLPDILGTNPDASLYRVYVRVT